jgi:hypothetical protein
VVLIVETMLSGLRTWLFCAHDQSHRRRAVGARCSGTWWRCR